MNHIFTTDNGIKTICVETEHGSQSIVDGQYSNYFSEYGMAIIADHVNQDFAKLHDCVVGTRGNFDGKPIICTKKEFGYNYLNSWLQHEDKSFYTSLDNADFLTYTCSGNGDYRVWLLEWKIDMKELELREKYVNCAKAYLGCKEADGSHKKIIDLYNSQKVLPRNYKVTYTDPWCATFVSAMAVKCGFTNIIPTECSCYYMVEHFKEMGRWVEDDSYCPKIGDIIFYHWNDSGVGDCLGVPDHVGLVAEVNGNSITIIEGNMSDSVSKRVIQLNGRYIRGYGIPNYASLASQEKVNIGNVSDWARESCEKAVRLGYLKGYGDGNYGWKDNITMERLVTFMDNLGLIN